MAAKDVEQPTVPSRPEEIVEAVRKRYGAIARTETSGCCGPQPTCCGPQQDLARKLGYEVVDLELLPPGANLGLGCGAPVAHLELTAGEAVLDLGSGAGIDGLIAARQVGPTGRVIGVDMTPEMVMKAHANASGFDHVEFHEGRLESLPVADQSVDAVTSNCVINLVPDKAAVFREVARVLRTGGRMVVSDVVLEGPLPESITGDLLAYVGCVAGALERTQYFQLMEDAGMTDLEILSDVDFLETVGDTLPQELVELGEASGISPDDVRGVVRSVTYRAWKR
jgi:SAM-dependent methyltransferase